MSAFNMFHFNPETVMKSLHSIYLCLDTYRQTILGVKGRQRDRSLLNER